MPNKGLHRKKSPKAGSKASLRNRAGGRNGGGAPPGPARRSDEGHAFLPDPYDGASAPARAGDPLAETLAQEFVLSATSAEGMTEDDRDEVLTEELGGPFTETTAQEEFASEPDASNPADASREPFPTATRPPS
jgi:hypothetical protein